MLQSGWSIRHGFVDEFKIPVFGHAVGQKLGGFVVVEAIDIADGFAVVIADINIHVWLMVDVGVAKQSGTQSR